jgi:hypothetical protein
MSDSRFRWLLILYVVISLAAAASSFVPGGYSQQLADAYAREPEPWLLREVWLTLAIGAPLLVMTVAGLVGLFLFRRWGRSLSLYSTIACLLLYFFSGAAVLSALESVLYQASNFLWGAILALSYYSPIAARLHASEPLKPDPLRASA